MFLHTAGRPERVKCFFLAHKNMHNVTWSCQLRLLCQVGLWADLAYESHELSKDASIDESQDLVFPGRFVSGPWQRAHFDPVPAFKVVR